ncbi:MAG TPA: hypothetical protein DIT04_03735, partial [Dysgonomonas sp.]|nr:hypothetical protein [Dysgonomonas sp.]
NDLLSGMADLKIYPNPVTTTLNVDMGAGQPASATAYIYSLSGRLMITAEIGVEKSIDVSSLTSGIYLIRIIDKNNPENSKAANFIKQD